MMEKVLVNDSPVPKNGPSNIHEIYVNLKKQAKVKNIPWNFSKFLVDKDGNVVDFSDAKQKKPIDFEDLIQLLIGDSKITK